MLETFLVYLLSISIAVFLLYLFGISLAPYQPSEVKNEHFECGLPASSSTPKKANFSFFIYAIMFIVADMSGLFFTLLIYTKDTHSSMMGTLFALVMSISIYLASKELKKGERDVKIS